MNLLDSLIDWLWSTTAYAQIKLDTGVLKEFGNQSKISGDPKELVSFVYNTIIEIAGVVFMLLMIAGGIIYLTGASNEEQTGKAKKMMIEAVIGLVLVLSAWAIGTFVIDALSANS